MADGVTKIDLDALEASARDALAVKSKTSIIYSTDLLALIARIRELEAALGDLVKECARSSEDPDELADLRVLLARGTVLP